MPSNIDRRQQRFTNRMTLAGLGRVRKMIYLRPSDFSVPIAGLTAGASPGTNTGCAAGSLITGCVLFPISTSSITTCATTNTLIPALVSSCAAASVASRFWAVAAIPVPADADTTGSILTYVDWTYGDAPLESGCRGSLLVNMGYLNGYATTPTTVRTAASVGGASAASYVGTTCGAVMSSCLGKLPSFTASDSMALVVLQVGGSAAAEAGTLKSGCMFVLGVRLEYLAKQLGRYSDE